jgi:signal transduction histidine kinase
MARSTLNRLTPRRLRRWLSLFFLALAIPSGVLVYQAYDQLKWEAFHRHRVLAEELARRIDKRYLQLIEEEEKRAFVDYNFLIVAGDPKSNFIQRSSLSEFPVRSSIPGLIGYFQVDAEGLFNTPLLPDSALTATAYGIQGAELAQRQALADRVHAILSENRLVSAQKRDQSGAGSGSELPAPTIAVPRKLKDSLLTPESATSSIDGDLVTAPAAGSGTGVSELDEEVGGGQAGFDSLAEQAAGRRTKAPVLPKALGRVEDLQLDSRFQAEQTPPRQSQYALKKAAKAEQRLARKERSALPEPASAPAPAPPAEEKSLTEQEKQSTQLRIHTFESEIDPFEMSLLDSGHIVLYRKVWRDSQRYIQGALIDRQAFFSGVIEAGFRETSLALMSDLLVAYRGDVLAAFSAAGAGRYQAATETLRGALLHQTRLSAPLSGLELIFSIRHLPAGPGGVVLAWITLILLLVLSGGFYGLYRLGSGQISLITQQQDFVSAVSHELKTPLTSIRMYGELLREGWASEEKKREYYDFIYDESERLTRLINNVLQLARLTRNDLAVELKALTVGELMDMTRSKIGSQVARAGFELNLSCPAETAGRLVRVDADYFTQIIINLVDNALKFSANAEKKAIDIACQVLQEGDLVFTVRDYGPGIPRDQMKKIFRLFYRTERELTRETVGTGIGLALVNQLVAKMQGRVDVVSMQPGAEFRIRLSLYQG